MAEASEIAALLAHTDWTRALARGLAGDAHLADDLVQEAWVAALERPPRTDRPLRGWLATVLRRRASDLGRERGGRERREQHAARDEALPSTHELVERAALQRTLVEAVLELDEPFRSTVLLRFFEGLPPREIARRSGVSVATVQSRLTRALERLRERLSRGGGRSAWLSALAPLLREPVVAPLLLGIPVMKTVAALVAVSLLVGWFLWPAEEDGGARVAAQVQETERVEDGDGAGAGGASAPSKPARTVSQRESGGGAVTRATPVPEPAVPARLARGRVLDTRGNGLANVALVLGAREDEQGRAGARCTSGPGGWFELELDRAGEAIVAADPGWATVLAGVVRTLGETRPLVVVAPELALAGLVVDENGVPVGGAELAFELPPGFGNEWGLALDFARTVGWRARSAADGSFALAGVPTVAGSTLRASLGGFRPHREPAPGADTRSHVIVLARPARTDALVHGVVVDPSGAPVADARVAAQSESTLTGADGTFTLDLAQPGARPPLVAARRGYQPAVFEPETDGHGAPLWPATLVLRLGAPLDALTGRVVDADGRPVVGARVWVDDPTPLGDVGRNRLAAENLARGDERFWSYEVSDAEGTFRLAGLMDRSYRVKALDPENLLEVVAAGVRASDSPLELVLPTDRLLERVAGRIVDARGEPVEGALVRLIRTTFRMQLAEGRQSDAAEAQTQLTGADGAFEFHDVPEDVGLIVTGDTILFAWAEVAGQEDVEAIEVVARLRMQLLVELDPPRERADGFRVLDPAGQELVLTVIRGDGPFYGPRMALVDGRSAVVSLDEEAATLVLLRGEETVARVPLNLAADEVNVVRY